MRKGLVVTAGVLGVGIASAAVYYKVVHKAGPHLAKITPARTVLWCESDDVSGTWDAFKKGKVYKSFQKSELSSQLEQQWSDLVEAAKKGEIKELKELGLPLSEQTLLRFVGQDVAFGMLAPASEGAPPAFVFMTQLDRLGIAKDLAVEGTDWSKIWEKLSKAMGGDKAGEPFLGVDIRSRKLPDVDKELHFALLSGVMVLSDNKDAVKDVISTEKGKLGSLADAPGFAKESAKLPKGEFVEAYADMTFFGDKARLAKCIQKCIQSSAALFPAGFPTDPLKAFDGEILDVLVKDLQPGITGVAVGASMVEGDLLEAKVTSSRSQEEFFKDAKLRDIPSITPDATVFIHAHGLHALLKGARTSPTWQTLAKSEAMQWVQRKIENPQEAVKLADPMGRGPSRMFTRPDGKPMKTDGTIFVRAGSAALGVIALNLYDEVAVAVDMPLSAEPGPAGPDVPNVTGFIRTQPIPRIAADLFTGYAAMTAARAAKDAGSRVGPGYAAMVRRVESDFWTLQSGAQQFAMNVGRDPKNVGELVKAPEDAKNWNGPYTESAKDPWGHDYVIDKGPHGMMFVSYGKDGGPAGLGENQDLTSENIQQISFSLFNREPWFEVIDHPKGKIYSANDGSAPFTFYWSQVGGHLVVGDDLAAIKSVLDRANGGDVSPAKASVSKLEDGEVLAVYVNQRRMYQNMMPLFEREAKRSPSGERLLNFQKRLEDAFDSSLTKVYVAKDYSAVSMRSLSTFGQGADAKLKAIGVNASPEPLCWSFLPADSFVSLTANVDPKTAYSYLCELATVAGGKEAVEGALKDAKQLIGHDVETDLVNKLGQSIGVALVVQDRLLPKDAPAEQAKMTPAVPALVLCVEVKDATFQAALLDSIRSFMKQINEDDAKRRADAEARFGPGGGGRAKKPLALVEKKLGDLTIQGIDSPDLDEMKEMVGDGLSPCIAFADGFLIVASSESALQKAIAAKKEGKNLSKSPAFAKVIGKASRQVAVFEHFDWNGVVDQVDRNAELLARNFAPAPDDMKAPAYPEYTNDPDSYEKLSQKFQKDSAEYNKKLADWREAKAGDNASELKKLTQHVRLLGGAFASLSITKDGMESLGAVQLDLTAATPGTGEPADEAMEIMVYAPGVFLSAPLWSAIAIPNLLVARQHGNEAAAIGALKTLNTAQAIFREGDKDGNGVLDYGSLAKLGQTNLIDSVLASGMKQGYIFECNASPTTPEFLWYATAKPMVPGSSGDRYFFVNQAGVIFYSTQPIQGINKETCEVPPGLVPTGK